VGRLRRIGEGDRIAWLVEAFGVERFTREIRPLGPRTRTSSLPPAGTSLSSTPGTGTPIGPARSIMKCAAVDSGEVSVVPHDDVIGTRSPVVRSATASSRSHRSCGSAAPA
jgi:hypothetical protein